MKKYFQAPWENKEIILILIATIGANVALYGIISYFQIESLIQDSFLGAWWILGVFTIQSILLILPLILATKIKHKLKKIFFGITNIGFWKTAWRAISGYLLFLAINLLIVLIIIGFDVKIPGYQAPEHILPVFGKDITSLIIAGSIIVIIGPIIEEIFFRGFLLRALSNKIGIILGAIISAGFFALAHMQFQSIIPIFILGLILSTITIRSKSIIPAIAFHIFNNAIAFTIQLLFLLEVIEIKEVI